MSKGQVRPIYFGGSRDPATTPQWRPPQEWLHSEEAFFAFIATVWSKQNAIPDDPAALARFDLAALRPAYQEFLDSGGQLEPRGTTVEEQWVLMQLGLRRPVVCLLNEDHAAQPIDRIHDVEMLPVSEIWERLLRWYENKALQIAFPERPARLGATSLMVYDGLELAHVVTAQTIWNGELHYLDPWPGRSLLCAENNAAGVGARESDLLIGRTKEHGASGGSRPAWRITAKEFLSVAFAVFLFDPPRRGQLARSHNEDGPPTP